MNICKTFCDLYRHRFKQGKRGRIVAVGLTAKVQLCEQ